MDLPAWIYPHGFTRMDLPAWIYPDNLYGAATAAGF
jgi:hypothetical protein